MINYIRSCALSLLCAAAFSGISSAQGNDAGSPAGEWLVKDKTAHMRILNCGGKFWGVISWAEKPGLDENNPEPALRSRPVLGMPILLGMASSEANEWKGDIYNADNGKIYHGSIALKGENILHVKGCVLGGFICGGEDWTRLENTQPVESSAQVCLRVNAKAGQ